MRLEFIGAAHVVTGSCHYLEFGGKHVLVDCGMEQGADIYENQDIPVIDSNLLLDSSRREAYIQGVE